MTGKTRVVLYAIVHYPKILFEQSIKFKTHYKRRDIFGVANLFSHKVTENEK